MESGASHRQLGAHGPQEIAALCSCEIGLGQENFLDGSVGHLFSVGEIERGWSGASTLGRRLLQRARPAAVPVLAMDLNAMP